MSGDLLIDPLVLDPTDFPPLPLQPGFTQLVSDELGNAATSTDGFDNVMGEAIAIVDALDAALGGLAGELLDAFGEADTIDPQPVSDTADGFTASLAPSDTAVGNLGTLLSTAALPAAPSGSTPSSIQVGTATAPVLTCTQVQPFPSAPGTQYPVSNSEWSVGNALNVPFRITAMTLVQPQGGPFRATTVCPTRQLQPGESCELTVTQIAPAPDGTTAQLQIETDGAYGTLVLCMIVGGAPPPSAPPTTGLPGGGGGRKLV